MDLLSGAALAQVQQMIRDYYGQVRGERPEFPMVKVPSGPEVYVAKSPVGGIPARSGTTLRSALCDLYRDTPASFGSTTRSIAAWLGADGEQVQRRVYNLSSEAVAAEAYIVITRTKLGTWVVVMEEC